MGSLDEALPPGPDWIGRKFADIDRRLRELAAARSIEATVGDVSSDLDDIEAAIGPLPAPSQVARRDEANTFALAQTFSAELIGSTYVELPEQGADPAAPTSNRVRIYAKDVGGKTAVFCRFPTGSAVQVAIEP